MTPKRPPELPSLAAEAYLRAIHVLEQKDGEVSIMAITRRMGFANPSVSEMVKRLAKAGWVAHERYGGVTLTEAGRRVVVERDRRQGVIERYLTEVLRVSVKDVQGEAERLERAASDELIARMRRGLGE